MKFHEQNFLTRRAFIKMLAIPVVVAGVPLPIGTPKLEEWLSARVFKCPLCGSSDLWYFEWTSDDKAHEFIKYDCQGCNRIWGVGNSRDHPEDRKTFTDIYFLRQT